MNLVDLAWRNPVKIRCKGKASFSGYPCQLPYSVFELWQLSGASFAVRSLPFLPRERDTSDKITLQN